MYRLIKIFYFFLKFFKTDLFYEKEQKKIFKRCKLDYKYSKNILYNFKKFIPTNYKMISEHIKIFAALRKDYSFKNILEIGTYDGNNAFILAKLFPRAKIDTIDLHEKNKNFSILYYRQNSLVKEKLLKIIKENINKVNNINFIKGNSINLIYEKNKKYDLIWIDGFHGNPVVTIDIINSLRLLKKDGFIMCDDIYLKGYSYDPYISDAAYKTLEELKKINLIKFDLFLKRIDKKSNIIPSEKKFIALIKKGRI